jgi:vitamin B12 transporter
LRWAAGLGELSAYFEAFAFARGVSRLIAYRRSSLGAVQPFNIGRARMLGAEFETGFEWRQYLRTVLVLTLLDPRDTTPSLSFRNDLVPYQSRLVSNVSVEGFVLRNAGLVRQLSVDARMSYRASRLADPAGLIVLPGSSEFDLGSILLFGADLSLRCAIDDIFDARHFDFIGYPVPGRSLHAALEAWF